MESNVRGNVDVLDRIEDLKEKVENAKGVLFSSNCIIDREYFLNALSLITENLPTELKSAKWVISEQQQIVNSARQEANNVIADAQERAVHMINEHKITIEAHELANQLVMEAQNESEEIRRQTIAYVSEKLQSVEESLTQALLNIKRDKQQL